MKINKLLFGLFLGILLLPICFAEVKISEVYYDPVATESGGEAVELKNYGSSPINISGWILSTPTSQIDATLPDNTLIEPGDYFLIADSGFSTSKDDLSWPNADYEEAITLKNTDGGLALKDSDGNLIDAIGWGNPANIDPAFYEGTPHEGTPVGESLQRQQDTDNNANDFSITPPNLQSSGGGGPGGSVANASNSFLTFTVTVETALPEVLNISIPDEDDLNNGSQIFPIPRESKPIPVQAKVYSAAGLASINSVKAVFGSKIFNLTQQQQIDSNTAVYQGSFSLEFYEPYGTKTLEITVESSGSEVSSSTDFDFMSLNAFEIDTVQLDCVLFPGQTCEILGDLDINSTDGVTLRNIGNTALDMGLSGSNLQSQSSTINVENIKYNFGDTTLRTLTNEPVLNNVDFVAGSSSLIDLSFYLDLPAQVESGTYVSEILLSSVPQ